MSLPADHPYLFASLLGLLLVTVVSLLVAGQRRMILLSGLLAVSLVPAAATANDTYWSPARLGHRAWGIEDVLFTFVVGGMAWFLAAWPFPAVVPAQGPRRAVLARFAALYAATLGGYMALWLAGVDALASSLVVHVAAAAAILARRRSLWPFALSGLLGSTALYFVFLKAVFFLSPDFLAQWNRCGPWYRLVLGVPAAELVWGGTFGAGWPLMVACACGIAASGRPYFIRATRSP